MEHVRCTIHCSSDLSVRNYGENTSKTVHHHPFLSAAGAASRLHLSAAGAASLLHLSAAGAAFHLFLFAAGAACHLLLSAAGAASHLHLFAARAAARRCRFLFIINAPLKPHCPSVILSV